MLLRPRVGTGSNSKIPTRRSASAAARTRSHARSASIVIRRRAPAGRFSRQRPLNDRIIVSFSWRQDVGFRTRNLKAEPRRHRPAERNGRRGRPSAPFPPWLPGGRRSGGRGTLPAGRLGDPPVQFGRHVRLHAVRRDPHNATVVTPGDDQVHPMSGSFLDCWIRPRKSPFTLWGRRGLHVWKVCGLKTLLGGASLSCGIVAFKTLSGPARPDVHSDASSTDHGCENQFADHLSVSLSRSSVSSTTIPDR